MGIKKLPFFKLNTQRKNKMEKFESFKNRTIISGTYRNQDLIPAFTSALSELNPEGYAQILLNPIVPAYAQEDHDSEWWDSEDAVGVLDVLINALEECHQDDYYFGAHPGDGSDFGFWKYED
jgi:hypothetical protein